MEKEDAKIREAAKELEKREKKSGAYVFSVSFAMEAPTYI